MKNFFRKLFITTKPCPYCGTKLRFPNNKGKLKITCPACKNSFLVDFQRFPFQFKWDRNKSLKENMLDWKFRFSAIYKQNPVFVWLWIAAIVFILFSIFRLFFPETPVPVSTDGVDI